MPGIERSPGTNFSQVWQGVGRLSRKGRVTSVQRAREALGTKLRILRTSAGLTGRELAERLSWPASKISKLENGKQTPSEGDVIAWVSATSDDEQDAASALAMLRAMESAHAEWQRLLSGGARHHQNTWAEMERKSARLRVFEPAFVPGLLQTAGYARHRLAQAVAVFGLGDDIDDAVRARLARQEILYDQRKRFHFVITEAVLRYRLCPPALMLAQLDRLVAASTLPNVRLGVIPFEAPFVIAPGSGFWIFDDRQVLVEIFSAELTLTQDQEIDLHGKVFGAMASVASYGANARAVITGVMEDLHAGLPDDDDADS
ncbi:transcriptional regulator [Spongiactinospora gelatinilytica]|uniref:Transcriptional regulator n=1 Tax=Spongiactinospora gelatinilytica TaxID=2666298 RepID=A0A2W2I2Q4_9ACTN|nr:transcriptional regulator [Spongiactinospora gelatinilytica]